MSVHLCERPPHDTCPPAQYEALRMCRLSKRYKRFLADVAFVDDPTGQQVVVHCPNTGPMTGLLDW